MKTTVIQLENHDDVAFIKDKLSQHSCQRVILVWPKRGRILNNRLEVTMLQRTAKSFGSELALVTHHPLIIDWAEENNLPVFASITAAEKDDWKNKAEDSKEKKFVRGFASILEKRKGIPRQANTLPSGRIQKGLVLLLSLAALAALFVVIVPGAEIIYYPEVSSQEIEIKITASETFSGINPSGSIPAEVVFTEVSGELARPSSGKTVIPTKKASGSVTFTNLTKNSVTIPAGTLLLTAAEDGILFATLEKIDLPAGAANSIEARVEAMLPGSAGNITAGQINSLVGEVGALVSVANAQDFIGGGGVETPSPTDSDYQILEDQLMAALEKQALASLQADLKPGMKLIDASLSLEKVLLKEQVNAVGQPSDEAVFRMTLKMKAITYRENDLYAIASLVLDANQPEGFQALGDEINLQPASDIHMENMQQASWTINASRLLIPDWNQDLTAQELTGKKPGEAAGIFSSLFAQSQPAKIKSWPWMPFLSTQIRFVNGAAQ